MELNAKLTKQEEMDFSKKYDHSDRCMDKCYINIMTTIDEIMKLVTIDVHLYKHIFHMVCVFSACYTNCGL